MVAGVALGYALVSLAEAVSNIGVSALAQHRKPPTDDTGVFNLFGGSPELLNFKIGDTVVVYGPSLVALFTLSLVACACLAYVRVRANVRATCPHCLSEVPVAATVCAHRLSELSAPTG